MRRLSYMAIAAMLVAVVASAATRSPKRDIADNLTIFNSVVKELQTFYVDSIDLDRAVGIAITAMLDDLDPYTEYIPAEERADFRSMTTGEYGGIGSYVQQRKGYVIFSEPAEGSPAQRAGIIAGDKILMIDGDSVGKLDISSITDRLKGPAGTHVKVTVVRPYSAPSDSVFTFDIERKKIIMPSVPYFGVVRDSIGYIALTSFTDKSPEEVRTAVNILKNDPRVQGIVLDLRGNGGGLLESAIEIVNLFVPKGTEVISRRGKGAMSEQVYKTSQKALAPDMPLVVLIDGGSASASEIVAGSLQDLDRAVIVGNRSFGKGLVQTTRQLPSDGMLKVTTSRYYIPSGRLIQAIDYSHRDEDGSVMRIPDSLTNVFYTKAGREVRDGGGITPDITIANPDINRLLYTVVRDNWDYDFATWYAAHNSSIATPSDFVITDAIYDDFKQFIDPERFEYDKVCETMLDRLRETSTDEGLMNDSVAAQFDILASLLRHDLYRDLDNNRSLLEPFLADQIVTRYYHRRGSVENALNYDRTLDTVMHILTTPDAYRAILAPPSTRK